MGKVENNFKNQRLTKDHLKIAYRVKNEIYDVLWISVSPKKKELFIVIPTKKEHKNLDMPMYDDIGKIIYNNANLDHITFHYNWRVHWRTKGQKYINKKDLKFSIFDIPPIETIWLFAITIALNEISLNNPKSNEPNIIFGRVRTEYATIVGYLAHESNAIIFYEEFLKKHDNSGIGPIFIHTGINQKILIIMKTELVPIDIYNGYLDYQFNQMPFNTTDGKILRCIATLLPNDYFEKYIIKSKIINDV